MGRESEDGWGGAGQLYKKLEFIAASQVNDVVGVTFLGEGSLIKLTVWTCPASLKNVTEALEEKGGSCIWGSKSCVPVSRNAAF